jgi:dTDP-4-amino-4,6-dideoxygalactose transaminase
VRPIRLVRPVLGTEELEQVRGVLATGYLTQGPRTEEFEALVAAYLGVEHAVATTSATTALHLAMVVLGIGPGAEVILPSFTFPATANVVMQQGAVPVLADIDLSTFNVSVASVAAKITARTRAVIAVHLFGLPADMDALAAVTQPRGIPVVEDAACALGARYHDRPCGTLGDIACFSFHPRKIVTTGEGGMVTTADPEYGRRARRLRTHGGERVDNRFVFAEPGFNYRMSDINAAVGIPQMRRLDRIVAERRRLAEAMTARLKGIGGLRLPTEPAGCVHTFQAYAVLLADGIDRDAVIRAMAADGIETTIGTYALHTEAYVQERFGYAERDLPGALTAWHRSLALPLYPGLTDEDVDRIASSLARAVGG